VSIKDSYSLGYALRTLRAKRGLTQAELASRTGLSIGFLSRVENNRKGLSHTRVKQIALVLAVPTSFFYLFADRSDNTIVKNLRDIALNSL
jgi:transcriptional regulator with XRE-family HTH domain